MSENEVMTVAQIDAQIAALREKKRLMRKSGKVNERKIGTLARRRQRLIERVQEIDNQIEMLRADVGVSAEPAPKRRGRKPKSMLSAQ